MNQSSTARERGYQRVNEEPELVHTNIAESDDGRAEDDKRENEMKNERGRKDGGMPFLENRSKISTPRPHAEANERQEKRVVGRRKSRGWWLG